MSGSGTKLPTPLAPADEGKSAQDPWCHTECLVIAPIVQDETRPNTSLGLSSPGSSQEPSNARSPSITPITVAPLLSSD